MMNKIKKSFETILNQLFFGKKNLVSIEILSLVPPRNETALTPKIVKMSFCSSDKGIILLDKKITIKHFQPMRMEIEIDRTTQQTTTTHFFNFNKKQLYWLWTFAMDEWLFITIGTILLLIHSGSGLGLKKKKKIKKNFFQF